MKKHQAMALAANTTTLTKLINMPTNQDIDNVLIFRIGSLGDTLVALPAFHLLRAQFQKSRITLLTNSPVDGGIKAAPSHQILMGTGLIDNYIEYPHGRFSGSALLHTIGKIRQLDRTTLIYLMPNRSFTQRLRDAFFFSLAGVWRIRGLIPKGDSNLHQKIVGRYYFESEASRLLRSIGFDSEQLSQPLFSLELQKDERDIASKILAKLKNPFIALSVGTKVPVNDWGSDRWAELMQKLYNVAHDQYALVFIGSQDEYERCQSIAMNWSCDVLNLCGSLNPRQSAAVLEKATLFVGHDSGPMHLASSVGIPCVSIFAARNKPGVWFPFGNEDNVFYNDVPCSNCKLSVCTEQKMMQNPDKKTSR